MSVRNAAISDKSETDPMSQETKVIHEQFEARVAETPDAIAVACGEREISYGELNSRANAVANELIRRGISRGTLAAFCMQRSPEALIAILGILKAGAAYVPLDPVYPDERLSYMLADSGAPIVLVHDATADRVGAFAGTTPTLPVGFTKALTAASNLSLPASGDDIAYVIYTSGSTGQPKGVLVRHKGVVQLVRHADYCDFAPQDVFLLVSPFTFDASTWEIWGPLLNGGKLAVLPPGPPAPKIVADAIGEYGVTTLLLTTGVFHLMVDQRPDGLAGVRRVLVGGDVLSPAHVRRALDALSDGFVMNGYGPTETTVMASCFRMGREYQPDGSIPIGRAVSGTKLHVLDEQGRPVAEGELYIGGEGVAAGYLNRPELTRQRFVLDPFSESPESRLYRTGDRVRMRADGNLEFLGRIDTQLKIAGLRIEPGEVEAALVRNPAIRQAAVAAESGPSADKQLIAYVVLSDGSPFSASAIRADLCKHVPRHMVPARFIPMKALPLTPHGKVDRAALAPPPQPEIKASNGGILPSHEQDLADIWKRVLGRSVNCYENFFDAGGTSMQLLEVHSILTKELQRDIPVTLLFEYPTVKSLARQLMNGVDAGPLATEARNRAELQRAAMSRRRS